jgi:hypothetical protein
MPVSHSGKEWLLEIISITFIMYESSFPSPAHQALRRDGNE